MAKGVGIAALALAILAIFIPLYGLFISMVASLCAVISALAGDRIFATASPIVTGANLFFLSPAFWNIMNSSSDKSFNYVILGVLVGTPFIAMLLNHNGITRIALPGQLIPAVSTMQPAVSPTPSPVSSKPGPEPPASMTSASNNWRTNPTVTIYRLKPDRTLYKTVALNTRPIGDFGPVHSELAAIRFARDGKLLLSIASSQPCAMRRTGGQKSLSDAERTSLVMLPGDILLFGDWELSFDEK